MADEPKGRGDEPPGQEEEAEPQPIPGLPQLRRLRDIAKAIGLSERTLYHLVRQGYLGYYMVGGLIMIDVEEFKEWLKSNYHPPTREQARGKVTPFRRREGDDAAAPEPGSG